MALIVVEPGLITPPVDLNVFVISSLVEDTPVATVFKGVMLFLERHKAFGASRNVH
ncbi:MAG: hypothetical protein AB8B82_09835 [Roseovarius sp.]